MNDLAVGIDSQADFESYCQDNPGVGAKRSGIEFKVQLLTQGNWPTYRQIDVKLPTQMENCIQVKIMWRIFPD